MVDGNSKDIYSKKTRGKKKEHNQERKNVEIEKYIPLICEYSCVRLVTAPHDSNGSRRIQQKKKLRKERTQERKQVNMRAQLCETCDCSHSGGSMGL